jgi:hypothetical protein
MICNLTNYINTNHTSGSLSITKQKEIMTEAGGNLGSGLGHKNNRVEIFSLVINIL